MRAVPLERGKQAKVRGPQGHVVVSGHHHPRKREPLQKAARRRKLIGTGPLGQIAAYHEDIGLLAPDPRANGRVEGIEMGRPKVDI